MKALIFDNKVIQIEDREFPVSQSFFWVAIAGITPTPEVTWEYDGTVFTAPPAPIRPPKAKALLSAEEIATELVRKGIVSRAEFDAIKTGR